MPPPPPPPHLIDLKRAIDSSKSIHKKQQVQLDEFTYTVTMTPDEGFEDVGLAGLASFCRNHNDKKKIIMFI